MQLVYLESANLISLPLTLASTVLVHSSAHHVYASTTDRGQRASLHTARLIASGEMAMSV